jgi:hypothetical protein
VTNRPLLALILILLVALPGHTQRVPGAEEPTTAISGAEAGEQREASIPAVQRAPDAFSGHRMRVEGLVVRTTRRAEGTVERLSFLLRDDRGDTISVYDPAALPEVGVRVQVDGEVGTGPQGGVGLVAGSTAVNVTRLTSPDPRSARDDLSTQSAPLRADACEAEGRWIHRFACSAAGAIRRVGPVVAGLLAGIAALYAVLRIAARPAVLRRRRRDDGTIPLVFGKKPASNTSGNTPAGAIGPAGTTAPDGDGEPRFDEADLERFDNAFHEDRFGDSSLTPSSRSNTIPVPGIAAGASAVAQPPILVEPPTAAKPEAIVPAALPASGASCDELVQLLPGRLEALKPPGHPEIRFFRLSSIEVPEITFGCSEGPAYRHVQLSAPTVSRTHARIRFVEHRWKITNLSAGNPVAVNGVELRAVGEERTLSDGDRVQIGEYLFRYRDTRG